MKKITHTLGKILPDLLMLSIVFIVGLMVLKPFFNFSLWGDDWLHFYSLRWYQVHNQLKPSLFISPYGGEAFFMYIMRNIFDLQHKIYYEASFIFRFIASTSIYIFLTVITKKRLAGFLGALLYIVSFSGIQSTDWVQNSNNYIAIAFLFLGLSFLYEFYYNNSVKKNHWSLFLGYMLLLSSFIAAVVRMHGLIFFYPIFELSLLISKKSSLSSSVKRIAVFIVVLLVLKYLGVFGPAVDTSSRLLNGLSYFKGGIFVWAKAIIFFIQSFSNLVFPPAIFDSHRVLFDKLLFSSSFFGKVITLSMPVLLINFIFSKFLAKLNIIWGVCLGFWFIFILVIVEVLGKSFGYDGLLTVLGGGFILLTIELALASFSLFGKEISSMLLFLLISPLSFLVLPHLYSPYTSIDSESRYLSVPEAGAIVLIVYLIWVLLMFISKIGNKGTHLLVLFSKATLFLVAVFLFVSNVSSVNNFLRRIEYYRNEKVVTSVWETIMNEGKKYKDEPVVLYFEYDDGNFFYNAINWVGDYRYAVMNNIEEHNLVPPIYSSTDQLQELFRKDKPFRIDNILAFKLENRKIYVQTEKFMEELRLQKFEGR